jgi:hypothetical protein
MTNRETTDATVLSLENMEERICILRKYSVLICKDHTTGIYNIRQIGDVKWFLGIRVERVLASRQLYLV